MSFSKYIAALGILIVLIPACQQPTEYSTELTKLDSLQNEMSALKLSIEDFDLKTLMMMDSTASVHSATLNAGIQDTLNREEWMLLATYTRAITKRLNKFDKKLNKLRNEVDTSLKQIKDLSADLEHNTLDKEMAMKYYKMEEQKAAELTYAAAHLKENATKAMETYYEDHESVDSLMEQISLRMQETVEQ